MMKMGEELSLILDHETSQIIFLSSHCLGFRISSVTPLVGYLMPFG